ncbi:MAG: NAD(P)-dependent glycerol-3-phosphate dehydrogenase [Candidatus Lightella neohaematopini]|nr:NAD(P)-dependent glycerol-3-phosphate dehydrogenase [Candidatus Lightella neohaematopini]MCV2528862.1 NAD(P)-dependent glycerol-3-phosphate dehydrogenase [Candidatus Lightella neohaematopini]
MNNYIAVIGTGSYGTALAIAIARNNNIVSLWSNNLNKLNALNIYRYNKYSLPNIIFPKTLKIEFSIKDLFINNKYIIIAVPSIFLIKIINIIKPYIKDDTHIILGTKGIKYIYGELPYKIVQEKLKRKISIAIISGPTLATELAVGLPTAITIASNNYDLISYLKKILHNKKIFRVYYSYDIIGVQLGGIIKNVIAIGVGISDGIGLGNNIKSVLITKGFKEIISLGISLGAKLNTLLGISGLGDLILTSTTSKSRNKYFGLLIAQGYSIKKAKKKVGQIVEGYYNIKTIMALSKRNNVHMPITNAIYRILYKNKNAYRTMIALLKHSPQQE